MTTSRYVRLAATADVASLRTATYNDRPHLVVPIVALVGDTVVRPVNSSGPEFVPAEELAVAPQGWNGRPVVPDHPSDASGIPVTANEPATLERESFGELFHTKFEDRKLKTEAYIDIDRALALGGDPAAVVSRLRAGEMIEVSVGAFITAIDRRGTAPNGDEYEVVWANIVPDHLAILPEGTTGACSVADGCGAPRVNKQNKETAVAKLETNSPSMLRLLLNRLAQFGRPRVAQDGESDNDVRDTLWSALQALEPGFDGIQSVFPDDGLVVYAVWLAESDWSLYRRGYTIADGTATLAADREQVEEVIEFRPVVAATDETNTETDTTDTTDIKETGAQTVSPPTATASASPGCSCNTPTGDKGDGMNDKIKDLVGKLIANEASPFTDENTEALAAFSEEQLTYLLTGRTLLAGHTGDGTQDPDTSLEAKGDGDGDGDTGGNSPAAEPTEEEAIAALPVSLREMIGRHQEDEKRARASLVTAIRAATEAYSEEVLNAKTTEDLNALSSALKLNETRVPDYSGQGLPHDLSADDTVDPPPSMADAVRAARAAAN